jgi:alkylation response protein AidB-like acyl-CoA dehydrogenase
MHHFLKATDIQLIPAYCEHSSSFRRAALVDRSVGSVHMGLGVCALQAGGHEIHACGNLLPHAIDDGKWQRVMLGWPPYVIGGGTPNIQKNVIAERLLGLPHDAP